MSDIYSAVTAAIGALKGPLHGGANEDVIKFLLEVDAKTEAAVQQVREKLSKKEKVAGFGHRVYRTEDPRATHLRELSEEIGKRTGHLDLYLASKEVESFIKETKKPERERRLLLGFDLLLTRHSDRPLHPDLRRQPHVRLDRAHPRAVQEQPADPSSR